MDMVLDVLCVCLYVRIRYVIFVRLFFFFKQKTAYEMRISDWSSDVCSSDLRDPLTHGLDAVGGVMAYRSVLRSLLTAIFKAYERDGPHPLYQFVIGHWLPFRWARRAAAVRAKAGVAA